MCYLFLFELVHMYVVGLFTVCSTGNIVLGTRQQHRQVVIHVLYCTTKKFHPVSIELNFPGIVHFWSTTLAMLNSVGHLKAQLQFC